MAVCLSVLMLFPGLRGYAMHNGQQGDFGKVINQLKDKNGNSKHLEKNEDDGIEMQGYSNSSSLPVNNDGNAGKPPEPFDEIDNGTMHSNDDNDNKVITSHGGSLREPGNIKKTAINAFRGNVKILKNNSAKLNCITSVKKVSNRDLEELTAEKGIRSDEVFTSSMVDFFSFPPTSVEELEKMSKLGKLATEFYSLTSMPRIMDSISQIDVENDLESVTSGGRNCGCCSPLQRKVWLCGFTKLVPTFVVIGVGVAAFVYVCCLFTSPSSEDGSRLSCKEICGLVLVLAIVLFSCAVVSFCSICYICEPCCNGFGCCCGKEYNFLESSVQKLKKVENFKELIKRIAFDPKKLEENDFLELRNWLQPKNLMVFIPLDPKIGKKNSSLEGKEYILSLTNYLDTSHDYIIPKLEEGDMRKIQESVTKVLDGDGVDSDEVEKIVENIRSVDSSMRKIQKSDLEVIISNWLCFLKSIKEVE